MVASRFPRPNSMFSSASHLVSAAMMRVRGQWCRLRYGVFGRHTIGKRLLVQGGLVIRGPGRIVLGDFVQCGTKVTLYTDRTDSLIAVGDHTFLNGSRVSCGKEVRIGAHCILADCRLSDSDYHGLDPERRDEVPEPQPIHVEDRVWLTMAVIVLKGVTIGTGSTITPASVVVQDVPPRSLYGGNPAKLIRSL